MLPYLCVPSAFNLTCLLSFSLSSWLTWLHLTDFAFSATLAAQSPPLHVTKISATLNPVNTGWLRQSPPPQEHANTEELESREILPETSPSWRPKLLLQPQIHLHRLPRFILQSCLSAPLRLHQCVEQCIAKSHSFLSQLMAPLDFSRNVQCTTRLPKLPEARITSSHPLPPEAKAHSSVKYPVLHLHSLPLSVVKSALHEGIYPLSTLPDISSNVCFWRPPETEVRNRNKTMMHKSVQKCHQTVDGTCAELKDNVTVKQEDSRGNWPEEEADSMKGAVLKNCPTDSHYVLRSQNPAECPPVNTLSGFTCGVPQKGLLQSKHKIRVDFKVCLSFSVFFFPGVVSCSCFVLHAAKKHVTHSVLVFLRRTVLCRTYG